MVASERIPTILGVKRIKHWYSCVGPPVISIKSA